ncbi:uncharacterized protein LOC127792497 [Diospyros lotus]|uniref:uncharacterized protein LOC127792497 n=1 Tax=Diospyros lotus TaxID=55363 RepID=UPI00225605A7|nr:uncharacterized protein LOC127792497 [Diospyros lotus]
MAGFAGRLGFLLLLTVLLPSLRNEAEARESKFFTSEALELVIPSSPSDSPAQAPETEALAPESEAPAPAPVSGSDDSYGNGYGLYGHETSEFPTTTTTTTTTTTIADDENQIQAEELGQQGFQEREKGYPYNSNNNGYYNNNKKDDFNGYYYNNKNGGFYNNNNNYNNNGGYVGGGREGKYYYGNGNSEDSYGNSGNSYEFDSMEEYERQQSQGGYFP